MLYLLFRYSYCCEWMQITLFTFISHSKKETKMKKYRDMRVTALHTRVLQDTYIKMCTQSGKRLMQSRTTSSFCAFAETSCVWWKCWWKDAREFVVRSGTLKNSWAESCMTLKIYCVGDFIPPPPAHTHTHMKPPPYTVLFLILLTSHSPPISTLIEH